MALNRPFWWKNKGPACWPWLPLAGLFRIVSDVRRALYRLKVLSAYRLPVPVVIVGNIAVGGSGKTPVVIWLVEALRQHGFSPAIVSRGYGGSAQNVLPVTAQSRAQEVGDEPVLLAQRTGVPIWIGADRVAAAKALLAANPQVDVIVADDGLQHYHLARDVEIVVLDPVILGNCLPMPAGPLRETVTRATQATLILAHGAIEKDLNNDLYRKLICAKSRRFSMQLMPGTWYRAGNIADKQDVAYFQKLKTRAVAGIGRPERFFETLHEQNILPVHEQAFPDHHVFASEDLMLGNADALLMTEKDAVKCTSIAPKETWVLPVDALIDEGALTLILERLHGSKIT